MVKKILIIDDEEDITIVLRDALEWKGYDCLLSPDGIQGVNKARALLPDLILCDIAMPHMNGYEVYHALQEQKRTALIPFVFLTARTARDDILQGMSLGVDDYIVKPFDTLHVLEVIERRLAKYDLLYKGSAELVENIQTYISATLPHELRTPLTGIIGFTHLLIDDLDDLDTETIRNNLRKIKTSAEYLYRAVENYILHSRLLLTLEDRDKQTSVYKGGQIKNSSNLILTIGHEKAKQYERISDLCFPKTSPTDSTFLAITEEHLKKIFEELYDNAFKFSDAGTPVYVKFLSGQNKYGVQIIDQGRGMTPAQIEGIGVHQQFERETYEQQGLGLGLVIVRQLINLFRGQFNIKSTYGQGTTVTVHLPIVSSSENTV